MTCRIVLLVRYKDTNRKFAMKKISKQRMVQKKLVPQVYAERDILSLAENPFIVSLLCTFSTRVIVNRYYPKNRVLAKIVVEKDYFSNSIWKKTLYVELFDSKTLFYTRTSSVETLLSCDGVRRRRRCS